MYLLYFYVDGSDLDDIEGEVVSKFNELIVPEDDSVWLVNERSDRSSHLAPRDIPTWNLGLNVAADAISRNRLTDLVLASSVLAKSVGRGIIVGGGSEESGTYEDWLSIEGSDASNIARTLQQQLFGDEN